jgi:hypothetical protein
VREGLPVKPFTTTQSSKAEIIEALALAFEQGSLAILNEPILLGELQAFAAERLPSGMLRYAAPGSGHDDTVMSLAIAYSVVRDSSRCYGLTTYLEQEQERIDAERQQRMQESAERLAMSRTGLIKIGAPPAGSGRVCSECGATCIAIMCTGGFRCSQCGNEWGGRQFTALRDIPEVTRPGLF